MQINEQKDNLQNQLLNSIQSQFKAKFNIKTWTHISEEGVPPLVISAINLPVLHVSMALNL